ncbi:MAG: thioesterase family protein [Stygiobacter sp.]|jgi:YbgC/YbaW family acyl-CoA thioester hydrolase|uniref:Thioesterase family protein n=1 Tax=Stygiobacter electus TaxID=3032292 RepID=A0AAE3NZ73_9BACT|nr:thioesterase family protein [Stygiobacter electus]MDF1611184.1 thioesterase family protein [Stygiobacter electus]
MFTSNIKVYFYDADPAGIIFYASIFKYVHAAYEDFLRSLSTKRNFFFDQDYILPIMHAEADFVRPIKVGDELKVEVVVSMLKKSSFEITYRFYRGKEFTAMAKTVHVCVYKEKFEKIELPQDFYEQLTHHLD